MRIYSHCLFPRLLDWAMDRQVLAPLRRGLLSEARGAVLEVGFGTGVNLAYYPAHLQKITAVDPNPGMPAAARRRLRGSPIPVDYRRGNAETLPLEDRSFETVVSTFTLCSIADVQRALQEIYRVLTPGGRFLFLEHGLSPDPTVQRWQHRLTPVSRLLGDGCHLNRPIRQLVEQQAFQVLTLEQFYLEHTPRIAGYLSQGIATK